jgi:3-hydroxypropanoate dehydrogenase
MKQVISKEAIQQLFTEARTHHFWLSQPVSDELLHSIYDLAKWGPTSVNSGPMRVVFIKSSDERKKLLPALTGSNISQVEAAPVTAIIAQDERFCCPVYTSRPVKQLLKDPFPIVLSSYYLAQSHALYK